MKHPSSIEAHSAPSHRCGHIAHWTRMKQILLIAVCSSGLLTANPTSAAEVLSAVSAPALFNQANAEQRAGRLGLANLKYERASLLAPGDPAIAQNLRAAQQKAGVSAPTVPMWQRPAHWLSFNELAGLASVSLLLINLLVFGLRLIPTRGVGHSRCRTTYPQTEARGRTRDCPGSPAQWRRFAHGSHQSNRSVYPVWSCSADPRSCGAHRSRRGQ